MNFFSNRINVGSSSKTFTDIVNEYVGKNEKKASSSKVVKTAEADEAVSSGQLDVEPLHQDGESTTMPKNGPKSKKEDGKSSSNSGSSKKETEKDEAESSGQPEAEAKLNNSPEVEEEKKASSEEKIEKKAGEDEAGKRDGTGPYKNSKQKEESDKGKRKEAEEDYDDEQGDVPGEQDTGPDEYEEDDDKEEDCDEKDKKKEAKETAKFKKIANLTGDEKSKLRQYWGMIYPKEYVDALLADK